ncbi:hypothetical protein H6P81_002261 [Aristolochia fimbriata]|uniref:Uncharacterized protein n=1 Tax=Aristolochia fimbriata TaxID=158543 RepID=A0AAV7F9Z4_ARIFI|nr:hypothetical protein H6P81_002261 [Aristolochia fimbriata]
MERGRKKGGGNESEVSLIISTVQTRNISIFSVWATKMAAERDEIMRLPMRSGVSHDSGGIDRDGGEREGGKREKMSRGLQTLTEYRTQKGATTWGLTRSRKGLTRQAFDLSGRKGKTYSSRTWRNLARPDSGRPDRKREDGEWEIQSRRRDDDEGGGSIWWGLSRGGESGRVGSSRDKWGQSPKGTGRSPGEGMSRTPRDVTPAPGKACPLRPLGYGQASHYNGQRFGGWDRGPPRTEATPDRLLCRVCDVLDVTERGRSSSPGPRRGSGYFWYRGWTTSYQFCQHRFPFRVRLKRVTKWATIPVLEQDPAKVHMPWTTMDRVQVPPLTPKIISDDGCTTLGPCAGSKVF